MHGWVKKGIGTGTRAYDIGVCMVFRVNVTTRFTYFKRKFMKNLFSLT